MFQVAVDSRGIPASRLSSKKFFADPSGLFREMKPLEMARAPVASSRYGHEAATPSQGSKNDLLVRPSRQPDAPRSSTSVRRGARSAEAFRDFGQPVEFDITNELRKSATISVNIDSWIFR
jgi:hypothetical protein